MSLLRCLAAVAVGLLPTAAWAVPLGGGADIAISPWRVIGSLLFCLALGAGAVWILRRHYGVGKVPLAFGDAPARRIKLIEQRSLGPQRSLALVEIDEQRYAVLIAPGAATLTPLSRQAPCEVPHAETAA